MKLDRNTNSDGKGKYALLHLRRLREKTARQPNWRPASTVPSDESPCSIKLQDNTIREGFYSYNVAAPGWFCWQGRGNDRVSIALPEVPQSWDWAEPEEGSEAASLIAAVKLLKNNGILTFGNESLESQFFVMKHGDSFTSAGLSGYASRVRMHVQILCSRRDQVKVMDDGEQKTVALARVEAEIGGMLEYALQIEREAMLATEVKGKIPD